MPDDAKPQVTLTPEVQDVMKLLISAIRVVKVYPSNNPIFSQSIRKAFEALSRFLEASEEYRLGVQKTHFTYHDEPFGKDVQVNRSIAQDLFAKGVREMIFMTGLTEEEFVDLCKVFSLTPEEMAMKSGISTILWENGATHIKVTEAGLDDVITTRSEDDWGSSSFGPTPTQEKKPAITGKTLVLGDLRTDPAGFGAGMVAFALKTKGENETVEDRLYSLYQQAGRKIQKDHVKESEELFEGLAKSVLALEPQYRERLIAGKLYSDLDAEMARIQGEQDDQAIPNPLHEIQTARFNTAWSVSEVTVLLKKAAQKGAAPPAPTRSVPELDVEPINSDLLQIARSLMENPESEDELRLITEAGMESDIIEAAIRTLIALIPAVRNPAPWSQRENELALFSGVISQLEDILSYLLQKNNYDLATVILKALHMPVPPEFQSRLVEALKKTANKSIIISMMAEMRKHPKSSPEYQSAYSYLTNTARKATAVLLELLADENDRDARIFMLDLLKEFGKNQFGLLGEHLTDGRWYVVRNIVSILAENKSDQAILLLRRAADNKNIQIRQEVLKALIANKGKKAATVLTRFFHDEDEALRISAIRGFADFSGLGDEEVRPLIEFLQQQPLTKKSQDMNLEAIRTLGKTGGSEAAVMLQRYPRMRWWKSRSLQRELRQAASKSVEQIMRRQRNGGQSQ